MDNVTHALAGALLGAATCRLVERRTGEPPVSFRRAAFAIGIVTAELPDADLMYSGAAVGMGRLGYLLHHRGHTHTVLVAVISAVVVWALALIARRQLRVPQYARPLLWLSVVGTVSHLALDYTNSYGVHPFWPINTRWFYGDAVFIVEPWFWVMALPPLLWMARGIWWRVLCALTLTAILVAAWRVNLVGTGVAAALTTGAVLWTAVTRMLPASQLATVALLGWLTLEAMFFAGSAVSRAAVRRDVGAPLRDVVLTPSPGNPLCLSALVVTESGGMYGATRAMVAPVPALRSAAECARNNRASQGATSNTRPNSRTIHWGETWSAPVAELREIATTNCEAAAALRFIRVPHWQRRENGDVMISDLRFGEGGQSFASINARPAAGCPHPVPNWEWPRSDILGAAAQK